MSEAKVALSAVDNTRAAFDSAKRNLKSIGDQASMLPAKFGTIGTAIAAAFTAVTVKGAINTLDQLDDLSEKSGIAAESLSILRYAGEVAGTPLEAIAKGSKKLATNMAELASGNKDAMATFKAVRVEVLNADGSLRSLDAVLLDLADRFATYTDGAEKGALAAKIFGDRNGPEMIPLLNQGSEGIRRLRGEAEGLGLVYGGELAKQAAEFNDNIRKLELSAEAAKVSLAGGLLPVLNDLIDTYIRLKSAGQVWTVMTEGVKGMLALIPGLRMLMQITGTGPKLSMDPGADINRLMTDRARIQKDRAFAEKRGLPTRDMDRELRGLDDLLEVSRLRQSAAVLGEGGDTGDAMSRRLGRGGGKRPAPIVGGDGGKDKAAAAAAKELLERSRILAELSGVTASYMEDLSRLDAMRKAGLVTEAQYVDLVTQLISKQPGAAKLIAEQTALEKDLQSTREKTSAMAQKSLDALVAENAELYKHTLTLGDEIEEIGLNTEQLGLLTLARMAANIERERENLLTAKSIEGNEAEVLQIERRIALMERERELTGKGIQRQAGADKAKSDQEAAEEFTKSLNADLKQAFLQAFQDSRNPAEAFAKGLATTIYSRVSTALAEALAAPITAPIENFIKVLTGSSGPGRGSSSGLFSSAGSEGIGEVLSAIGIPGFATGGDHAGGLRIVGETGMELEATGRSRIFNAEQTKDILRGAGGGRAPLVINNYLTVGDVASQAQVSAQLRASEQRTLAAVTRSMTYGGRLA